MSGALFLLRCPAGAAIPQAADLDPGLAAVTEGRSIIFVLALRVVAEKMAAGFTAVFRGDFHLHFNHLNLILP